MTNVAQKAGSLKEEVAQKVGSLKEDVAQKAGSLKEEVAQKAGSLKEDVAQKAGSLKEDVAKKRVARGGGPYRRRRRLHALEAARFLCGHCSGAIVATRSDRSG